MKLFQSVLIVDDRPEDVQLTEIALSMIGDIPTDSVSSGEQALEFLRVSSELPGMMLLDLKMPGMNGIETLRRIRADERYKNLAVVIVTCSSLESDQDASMAAGATGFVQKAIRINEFSDDLKQYVK